MLTIDKQKKNTLNSDVSSHERNFKRMFIIVVTSYFSAPFPQNYISRKPERIAKIHRTSVSSLDNVGR